MTKNCVLLIELDQEIVHQSKEKCIKVRFARIVFWRSGSKLVSGMLQYTFLFTFPAASPFAICCLINRCMLTNIPSPFSCICDPLTLQFSTICWCNMLPVQYDMLTYDYISGVHIRSISLSPPMSICASFLALCKTIFRLMCTSVFIYICKAK